MPNVTFQGFRRVPPNPSPTVYKRDFYPEELTKVLLDHMKANDVEIPEGTVNCYRLADGGVQLVISQTPKLEPLMLVRTE